MEQPVDDPPARERRGSMKSFYAPAADPPVGCTRPLAAEVSQRTADDSPHIHTRARIAVYDAAAAAPRVEEVHPAPVGEYIEALTSRVYELSRAAGGTLPYTVVREVAENLIHADFAEPVVSILDNGATLRFADQGPGISDKEHALLPGFTTAHGEMKRYIRGVGSGLPIVRDYLSHSGGSLKIEDNLGAGSVVTIQSFGGVGIPRASHSHVPAAPAPTPATAEQPAPAPVYRPRLTTRQKQVLAIVLESGSAGPSLVAKELGVGISTAYRDLASLEELGLTVSQGGKRALTQSGAVYLDDLTTAWPVD